MSSLSSVPPRYIASTAGFIGAFVALNSAYGAFNPRGALAMLGFPTPAAAPDRAVVEGMTRMFATSRVVLGITMVTMWWYEDHKVLGVTMLSTCLMALADGLATRKVIEGNEWRHWSFMPVGAALGLGLIFGSQ